MRSLPARLSVLLLLAVLTASAAGGTALSSTADVSGNATVGAQTMANEHPPYVGQPPNTTSYLRVPADELARTGYTTTGVDIPGSMAIDRQRLQVRMATDSFETQFRDAASASNRTAAVTAVTARYEAFVDGARQRQRAALRAYSNDAIGLQGLVRSLALADATATTVESGTDRVRDVGNEPLDYGIGGTADTRLTNMEAELVTVSGELRELFRTTVTGQRQTKEPVYVEASESDVVVATIVNDNYLRESYIDGAYNRTFGSNESGISQRIIDLYNWAYRSENYISGNVQEQVGNTSVWRSQVTHRQGQFELHFDANTDGVYKERQTKRLRDAEPLTTRSVVNGSLRLVVNETHDTGPMEVRLLDAGDQQPRNGTLYIDGERVGTTGDDGRIWTVDARGDTAVRVETPEQSVSMFVYAS